MCKGLMAAAMAMPLMTSPVYAEDKTTTLTMNVPQSYTWTVPAEVNFGQLQGLTATTVSKDCPVTVSKSLIPSGSKLNITIGKSSDKFQVTNASESVPYTVTDGSNTVTPGNIVLSLDSGTTSGSKTLKFNLATTNSQLKFAGTYKGTITFIAVVA